MKRIRVLMLGWEYPPYVRGGLGTHCYYLTRALAKLPVKIYFITPHPIHKKRGNLEIIGLDISQKFKEDGKILSYGKFTDKKVSLYTKKIDRIIKKFDFDIIHCQGPIFEASIRSKKLSKKPLVTSIHSTEFDKAKVKMDKYGLEKKGMKHSDAVIAVSAYINSIVVKKYGVNQNKVTIIPNAIKQKRFPLKKKDTKTKYILSLGRLVYQKGIPYLIEAAKKVVEKEKNIKFLIAGFGSPSYEEKLKKKVKKLGLEKDVIFLGYVKNGDYYYRKSYLFVMPSISEPFGITPLEAMINGTPVLISKQSGISEFLKSCLKFNYWNTNDLAKKILFLIRDKKAYNKLRREGTNEVKKFTWEGIAKETLELYKKVLKLN